MENEHGGPMSHRTQKQNATLTGKGPEDHKYNLFGFASAIKNSTS